MGPKKTFTIPRDENGKAVFDINLVIAVWSRHFDMLSTSERKTHTLWRQVELWLSMVLEYKIKI